MADDVILIRMAAVQQAQGDIAEGNRKGFFESPKCKPFIHMRNAWFTNMTLCLVPFFRSMLSYPETLEFFSLLYNHLSHVF